MKATAYLCDRCKAPVNGKGYSVSFGPDGRGLDIFCGIDGLYPRHYCGRQCLMVVLNERVDEMEKTGGAATPPARLLHPYTVRRSAA